MTRPLYPSGMLRRWLLGVLALELLLSAAAFAAEPVLPIIHECLGTPRLVSPYAAIAGDCRFARRIAWTDRGRPIHLRSCRDLPAPDDTAVEAENAWLREHALDGRVVRTGNPGPYSNCFGWTFTGGRFAIDDDIERILEDNGYEEVDRPQPGDLVVYENAGAIVHVGIVRRCDSGQAIVESKWGARARYHHPIYAYPEPAEYRCVFYRSPRHGHQLNGVYD